MRAAFFFDRDGVVNVSPGDGYVLCLADFRFNEGIVDALAFVKACGYALILVTSQQGVGKGLMTQADLDVIHAFMQHELAKYGAAFDGIYACTCLAADPLCTCRKPRPEMIELARREHGLDLSRSWLVGDHDRDIQMAINAGVPNSIRIRNGSGITVPASDTLNDVACLAKFLRSHPNITTQNSRS